MATLWNGCVGMSHDCRSGRDDGSPLELVVFGLGKPQQSAQDLVIVFSQQRRPSGGPTVDIVVAEWQGGNLLAPDDRVVAFLVVTEAAKLRVVGQQTRIAHGAGRDPGRHQ